MINYNLIRCCIATFILANPTRPPQAAQDGLRLNVSLSQGPILKQIIDIARNNNVPLGVVVKSDEVCKNTLKLDDTDMVLRSLIKQINRQLNQYSLTIDSGTIVLKPTLADDSISRLLETKIPYFRPENATMQGLGQYLWIYVRAVIKPDEGSISSILSDPDSPTISSFKVDGPVHVVDVLNRIVQQNTGGVWIISGLSANWEQAQKRDPIQIRDYSDRINDVVVNACLAAGAGP